MIVNLYKTRIIFISYQVVLMKSGNMKIRSISTDATNAATVTTRDKLLARRRRRDLNTVLSDIAHKVDFDDNMKCSTSVWSIWEMIDKIVK